MPRPTTVTPVNSSGIPLLWLCGPSGVGKSTVGFEIFSQLSRAGIRAAFLDTDQISLCYPPPTENTHELRSRGLGAIWPNLTAAGIQCLVLSGFVDAPEEVRLYTDAVPDSDVTMHRLRVDSDELRQRFINRGWRPDLVDGAIAEADSLDHADFTGGSIDTSGLTASQVAGRVLDQVGALPRISRTPRAVPAQPSPTADTPLPSSGPIPVLWICGAAGVGKSTVGFEIYLQIVRSGTRAAYVDLQQIGFLHPTAENDPDNHQVKAANLAALWPVFRNAGTRCLVISGHVGHPDIIRRYADLLPGTALTVCRLHADSDTLAKRILLRGQGHGPAIPGDRLRGQPPTALYRIAEHAALDAGDLERARIGDIRVDTDEQSVEEIARQVRALADGWPSL
ncbi:adenylyl-sulfate kinase, partial [Nonomuraea sp. RK-328]|nr:adenylyl-sulfate kinase [Nonomuraea sp. RK-328]